MKTYCSLQRIHLAKEMKGENFCNKVAITTLSTNWTPNSACKLKEEMPQDSIGLDWISSSNTHSLDI